MPPPCIGIVTGANKGIGLAIVRQSALQYPQSTLRRSNKSKPLLIYLTSRTPSLGQAALKSLYDDDPLLQKAGALRSQDKGGWAEIRFHQLDIADQESRKRFREFLEKEHGESAVDFVVNNAGIALEGFNNDVVQQTLATNYHGTLHFTQTLLPLLRPTGRIVNVSSTAGSLSKFSPSICSRFRTATSLASITTLMSEFTTAVASGTEKEAGWPSAAYAVSKAGTTGLTRVLALAEQEQGGRRWINACCPGWVDTDMTKHRGTKTVDQGAETPVLLAMGEIGGVTGEFWTDGEVVEW